MKIKIKNVKNLKELEQQRRERINNEVLKFLNNNRYKVNKIATDPLGDLIQRIHKDGKKVMTDIKNETLNRNPVNGKLILTFDLFIFFQKRNT